MLCSSIFFNYFKFYEWVRDFSVTTINRCELSTPVVSRSIISLSLCSFLIISRKMDFCSLVEDSTTAATNSRMQNLWTSLNQIIDGIEASHPQWVTARSGNIV